MRDFMVINYRQVYEVAFIGVWSGYFVISSGELSGLMERLGDNVISRKKLYGNFVKNAVSFSDG